MFRGEVKRSVQKQLHISHLQNFHIIELVNMKMDFLITLNVQEIFKMKFKGVRLFLGCLFSKND